MNKNPLRQVADFGQSLGINLDDVTQQLEDEGIDKFVEPFEQLLQSLQKKRGEAQPEPSRHGS